MKNALRLSLALTLSLSLFLLLVTPARAACNFHQLMTAGVKNVPNFTSTCTITAVEGVDNPSNSEASTTNTASITLATNSSITINNGGQLVTGTLAISGGSVAIQNGGLIKLNTPLYVADGDGDGWSSDTTFFTATSSGRRRLGLMRDFTTADCGDSTYSTNNSCCTLGTYYADGDGDTYGAGSSFNMCPASGYVANNTDCDDASSAIHTTNVTGGTITSSGGYKIHTFTGSGTLTVSCPSSLSTQALVVAGGGAGGYGINAGGGGGAGGVLYSSASSVTPQAYTVTVGAGGAGGTTGGASATGQNSSFNGLSAIGGGWGGNHETTGSSGGSGGGTVVGVNCGAPACNAGTSGQGNAGGCSCFSGPGGGGGAGAVGQLAAYPVGGDGGIGAAYSISGASVYYGGGGGTGTGPNDPAYNISLGGTGGGGTGGQGNPFGGYNATPVAGTANTGGGGGGGGKKGSPSGWQYGASGGSGIVIIRYLNP